VIPPPILGLSSAAISTTAANAGGLNPDDDLQDANILDAAAELHFIDGSAIYIMITYAEVY